MTRLEKMAVLTCAIMDRDNGRAYLESTLRENGDPEQCVADRVRTLQTSDVGRFQEVGLQAVAGLNSLSRDLCS